MTTVRLQTGLFVSAGSEPRTRPRGVFRSPGGTSRPDNAEAVDRCGGRKRISLTWCAGRSLSSHRIVHEARAEDVVRRVVRPPKVSNAVSQREGFGHNWGGPPRPAAHRHARTQAVARSHSAGACAPWKSCPHGHSWWVARQSPQWRRSTSSLKPELQSMRPLPGCTPRVASHEPCS